MSEPLYHVGQHVAVCAIESEEINETVIIPQTTVLSYRLFESGTTYTYPCGFEFHCKITEYLYIVDGGKYSFPERCLCPINPDTEYQETEETTRAPA